MTAQTETKSEAWRMIRWPLLAIVLVTPIFWVTDLDLWVSGLFYDPTAEHPFPVGQNWFWQLLYDSIPFMMRLCAVIVLLILLLGSLLRKEIFGIDVRALRLPAGFFLICMLVGPGLITNSILKDNMGRPRPIQTDVFGGQYEHHKPWEYGIRGEGKAFASGHSASAFGFFALFFLWRNRKPLWAKRAFYGTLVYGTLVSGARIVQGGHHLSDCLWAAFIAWFGCWLTYYYIFRMPQRGY